MIVFELATHLQKYPGNFVQNHTKKRMGRHLVFRRNKIGFSYPLENHAGRIRLFLRMSRLSQSKSNYYAPCQ